LTSKRTLENHSKNARAKAMEIFLLGSADGLARRSWMFARAEAIRLGRKKNKKLLSALIRI
jgi:hypothetical protein